MIDEIIAAKAVVAAAYVQAMVAGGQPDPNERDIIEKAAKVANGVVDRFSEVKEAGKAKR